MRKFNFNKPRLRQCYLAEAVSPHALFLLSEHRHLVFDGEIFAALLPYLDGQHDFGQMLAALAGKFQGGEVLGALQRLNGANCLVEGGDVPVPENAPFWDHVVTAGEMPAFNEHLRGTTVSVRTIGDVTGVDMKAALLASGLEVVDEGKLLVVVTDDYLREELAEISSQFQASGRSWVLVKPVGIVPWIGPLFKPGETACWHCLEQRLRSNRQVERYIRARSADTITLTKTRLDSLARAAVNMASIEIAKAIVMSTQPVLYNKIRTLDLMSYQLEEHTLVRRPQCKNCGQPYLTGSPKPIVLESGQKLSGGRTAEPEETFRRYQYHISPVTGTVTSFVKRDLQAYGVIHNYVAGHFFPVFLEDAATLQTNLIARSGGKGTTESQAKASALAESLERYSGIRWGEEYTVRGSYSSMGKDAVHMREILLFSDEQYRNQREWNAEALNQRHFVPDKLDDTTEIAWTPAWSLTHEKMRYLPTAMCFYGHMDQGTSYCRCDSNGCAAGNTREEAIVQGFLELAERDAVAIWWYNRVRRPAVDVSTFDIPYWSKMEDYYRNELKRDLHVLDITNDLGVPTFVAVSRLLNQEREDIIIGVGSHLTPNTALTQALVESNQSVPILHFVGKDGLRLDRHHPKDVLVWLKTATYANQPYLVPAAGAALRKASDFRNLAGDDVRNDVLTCVEIAKAQGQELLVLDQTRPDVGLPVVRVVSPGLRHFWRRLAPGRLYDVPVKLGWQELPVAEADINPVSFFI